MHQFQHAYKFVTTLLLLWGFLESGLCVPAQVKCPEDIALDATSFFPHERNCTKYYECVHGSAVLQNCPTGTHWNPSLNMCDWPWQAGCKLTSGSIGINTRDGSSVCPSAPEPDCPDQDPALSVFFPHPYDCEWFFHCSNGVAYCKVCPSGLHWNPTLNTCDWPGQAGCTSSPSTGCPKPEEFKCPVPQPSYEIYYSDYSSNCSNFYQCSNGVVIKMSCPSGTRFDSTLQVCNYADQVECCNDISTSQPEITSAIPTQEPSEETSEESSEETNEDVSSSSSSEEE
ncbi:hypothetical protein C0J52_06910 [Blattella germanica]|nr:hypothetical protein C0J52_06910 [Blattella germanica]